VENFFVGDVWVIMVMISWIFKKIQGVDVIKLKRLKKKELKKKRKNLRKRKSQIQKLKDTKNMLIDIKITKWVKDSQ